PFKSRREIIRPCPGAKHRFKLTHIPDLPLSAQLRRCIGLVVSVYKPDADPLLFAPDHPASSPAFCELEDD
ncbi:MAG: hypothetical protein E6417_32960, partial [Bradyrhizobium sp.]|nr:hypothetical protein [Bradyrhizobium sp.]